MIKVLHHLYETLRYPDRWNVSHVEIEFEDGETVEFEDPDYWGAFDYEFMVLPKDQPRQIHIERDSVKTADVTVSSMEGST